MATPAPLRGHLFHVMNRGNGRMSIFDDEEDFEAFERILIEALRKYPEVQLIAYCVMPNHWHLILHPLEDRVLSRFVGWLTLTHTTRWQTYRGMARPLGSDLDYPFTFPL